MASKAIKIETEEFNGSSKSVFEFEGGVAAVYTKRKMFGDNADFERSVEFRTQGADGMWQGSSMTVSRWNVRNEFETRFNWSAWGSQNREGVELFTRLFALGREAFDVFEADEEDLTEVWKVK